MNFFEPLFDTTDFPARWHCGTWTELHGWTHIISDCGIFVAYFSIPLALMRFVYKREDMPFPAILWLFSAFIFFCGLPHLNEAIIFWEPVYRWAALIKVVTALVSLVTAAVLIKNLPHALRLPGLERVNLQLTEEVEQRKEAEAVAQKAHADLQKMFFVASHDLREPLRAIVSFSELLESDAADKLSPDDKALLDRITSSGKKMTRLLDDLREVAKVRDEKSQPELIDPNEVFEDIEESLSSRIEESGAKIERRKDLPQIYVSTFWAERIFTNLLTNAIKYAPENGSPQIEIGRYNNKPGNNGTAAIEVCDRNETIPESKSEAIFDLFFRNTHRKVEGTGSGLAIVREAVTRSGGRVWHEPREGGGNRFVVSLPGSKVEIGREAEPAIDS